MGARQVSKGLVLAGFGSFNGCDSGVGRGRLQLESSRKIRVDLRTKPDEFRSMGVPPD